jgi:hypothetical protein
MIFCTTPHRLVVPLSFTVLAWLLFFTGVLPADLAVSVSFIVISYTLKPMSGRSEWSQHRRD